MKTQTISGSAQFVLDHYGLEEGDFEQLDKYVDWDALYKYIRDPTKIAVCNILDVDGKIVVSQGGPIRVHKEVAVANFKEELKKKSLVFVEWW